MKGTLDLLKDQNARRAEIKNIEDAIRTMSPTRAKMLFQKSRQLATYMNHGVHGLNLLRNAESIAHLFDEVGQARQVDPALIGQIDALVTLYAMDGLSQRVQESLADLIDNEAEGMTYVLSYLVGTRKDEQANITGDISRINSYKGYVPSISQNGASLVVADDLNVSDMNIRGFSRVGTYSGSSAARQRGGFGYYLSPISSRATYNQGVLQTVHQTVNGIQPNTGFTVENIAGRITDPVQVQRVAPLVRNQRATVENLLPVRDANGKVVAYERGMDPNMVALLNKSTNLFDMIGAWRGRQVEEKLAQVYNEQLIEKVGDMWDKAKADKTTNEFVDISRSSDPIHKDSWGIIPDNVREMIKARFGREGFPVRRDAINDTVGFRSASVGDWWTGDTRLNDKTADTLKKIAIGIFDFAGDFNPRLRKNTYTSLVQFERTAQSVVTELKVLIVVKSVIVPLANTVSNLYQLMHRGVPLRHMVKAFPAKTAEVNDYVRRRAKEVELDADLKAAQGRNDTVAIRKLTNQIQTIQDSYRRMSIWPLIEAGEFSAITEGGVSNDDLKLSTWIDRATKHLPDGLQTPYRYAVLTKDTSLFKGMALAVQYSDFLAKSVYYDDLRRRKVSKADALAKINEEFINYNRHAGRVRNYTESTGMAWFWNFKLRSIKVAISMMRDNPARSLMMMFMPPALPFIGNVGTPISDNMAQIILDGKLGNSVGFATGMRAPSLIPWYNAID